MQQKKILYFDMDNVLVDFKSGIDREDAQKLKAYEGRLDEVPGIFSLMDPMPGAIEAFEALSKKIRSLYPFYSSLAQPNCLVG